MKKVNNKIREELLTLLAQYLGVESSDIQEDDELASTLNLGLSDLFEFTQFLVGKGFETTDMNLQELTTVEELLDAISDLN